MLEGLTPPVDNRAGRCKVRTVAEELEPEDAKIFWDAVNDQRTWSAYGLGNALRGRGLTVSVNTILRHRNGGCSC